MSNRQDHTSDYVVYMHTNKLNNKVYVGITCQPLNARWHYDGSGYFKKNKDGFYHQPKFARAIQKYGWDSFEHIVWADGLSYEQACRAEKCLIAIWDTVENGYNISAGGYGNPGRTVTDEVRQKMSERRKGLACGENNWMYGKKHTAEELRKMSENRKGKSIGKDRPNARSVVQYDKNGNMIRIWDYMKQAADELGISRCQIGGCCRGDKGYLTAGGFIWKYLDECEELLSDCMEVG